MSRAALTWIAMIFLCGCNRDPLVTDEGGDDGGELQQRCAMGCADISSCAPREYGDLFADDAECQNSCYDRFEACQAEAYAYMDCVAELPCDDIPVLLIEGPAATACSSAFDATLTACE